MGLFCSANSQRRITAGWRRAQRSRIRQSLAALVASPTWHGPNSGEFGSKSAFGYHLVTCGTFGRAFSFLLGTILTAAAQADVVLPGRAVIGGGAMKVSTGLEIDSGGATLKTDPEMDRLLQRATEFAEAGRYDLAATVWQNVLDRSADVMVTSDALVTTVRDRRYRLFQPVASHIEAAVADLPQDALSNYRLVADGQAQAVLAAAAHTGRRKQALSKIAQQYFLSSLGDDAAFELACLALDRYDFAAADRLLTKLAQRYPDPSVPRREVLLRRAVVEASQGRRDRALAYLDQLGPEAALLGSRLSAVRRFVEQKSAVLAPDALTAQRCESATGGVPAGSALPALPAEFTSGSLSIVSRTELLQHDRAHRALADATPDTLLQAKTVPQVMMTRFGYRNHQGMSMPLVSDFGELVEHWQEEGWTPTGGFLFDGRRLLVKSPHLVLAFDAAQPGKLDWAGCRANLHAADAAAWPYAMAAKNGSGGHYPRSQYGMQMFADRVHQSMSIVGDRVYVLEGPLVEGDRDEAALQSVAALGHPSQRSQPRRSRRNFLAAYDLSSGQIMWRTGAHRSQAEEKYEIGFLAAPTGYGDLLLLPISDNGSLWIYAVSATAMSDAAGDEGGLQAVWKTFLCDEPQEGCSPWSPVDVSIEGDDAYVATGAGVVFALDAGTGAVRWAVGYPRTGQQMVFANAYVNQHHQMAYFRGFAEDRVMPYGGKLVVLASDYGHLFALDRADGALAWDSPVEPVEGAPAVEYAQGLLNGRLYLAGRGVVRCYQVEGGRLEWETRAGEPGGWEGRVTGRGVLTCDSIYLPVQGSVSSSIVRLALDDGRLLQQVGVRHDEQDKQRRPLGNLFSDGRRLFALGPNHLVALAPAENSRRPADGDVRRKAHGTD